MFQIGILSIMSDEWISPIKFNGKKHHQTYGEIVEFELKERVGCSKTFKKQRLADDSKVDR
jgi:hypothetical protein